jgi:hypothetical protein
MSLWYKFTVALQYTCRICGDVHPALTLSWGPDAPDLWARIPKDQREQRGEINADQCLIFDEHFFIRGRLEIQILDTKDVFAWLVWAEVSKADFEDMSSRWDAPGREEVPPYDARLANRLPIFSPNTFDLPVQLLTRPVGQRPLVRVSGPHPLAEEQERGITLMRVQEIAESLSHQP